MYVQISKWTPLITSLKLTSFHETFEPGRLIKALARQAAFDRGEQSFLPYLQSLRLTFVKKSRWSWAELPLIFGAPDDKYRSGDRMFLPSQRPLQTLYICVLITDGTDMAAAQDVIDLQTLERLSYIARRRGVRFSIELSIQTAERPFSPPRSVDLLQSSARAYNMVWDRYLKKY
jgi:hypothetical protein